MRELIARYLRHDLTRRGLVSKLAALGLTAAGAREVVRAAEAAEQTPDPSAMAEGTGGWLVARQMRAAGVKYLFTNPGSFEVGLFDAFVDQPDMHLIMGLHEGIVVAMADGYARVSGQPGFVNVHVIAGTAQMAGQLYNSARDGVPVVVTAGLNDNEVWSDESQLAPRPGFDQKEVARQFTKISWEARQAASLPLMLRRALKTAMTPPGGPVYLAMAHYALESRGVRAAVLPASRFMIPARPRPNGKAVEQAARLIDQAKRPLIVVGDEVWRAGAVGDLVRFAELTGAPVVDFSSGYKNMPVRHAQYQGGYSPASTYAKAGVDLLLAIGCRDFGGRVVPGAPEAPPSATIVRIGMDTASMSRNYATDLALVADVKEALNDLLAAVKPGRAEARRALYPRRGAPGKTNFGLNPMHPDELGWTLAHALDPNTIVVSENLTGRYEAFPFGYREDELWWISNTSAGLGWGIGAAIGAKLAAPKRPVVCAIGDGSVMYSAAGFWTMARYQVPVLTVVWNNRNYQTVRLAYHGYGGRMAKSGHYAGMYLGDPDIDFAQLAASQGVKGEKVVRGADLAAAIERGKKATRDGQPYLLDVAIARYGGGAESSWHGSFKLGRG